MWYFISQAQKITNSRSFYLIFNRLGKIQDGNHVWWRHRAPAGPLSIKYTSSCLKDQKLSTQGKIVSKYCNVSKTLGRSSINPSIMYHGGGTTLRKNEGECFIMGSKAERQMKAGGRRLRAFVFYQVFGTRVEAWSPSFFIRCLKWNLCDMFSLVLHCFYEWC